MTTSKLLWLVALALTSLAAPAFGITCGSEPTDSRFLVVCGLAPRNRAFDENWFPEGSGVLVQWIDGQGTPRIGITAARHFIDSSPNPASGQCVAAQDGFYAYFKGCIVPPPNSTCALVCTDEDTFRVRVKCFMLATGAFDDPDGVAIGTIEPADVPCLSHITPIKIASPIELGVSQGDSLFIAGWGETLLPNCGFAMARSLHVAETILHGVQGFVDGRNGRVLLPIGTCNPCQPTGWNHDSGGGMFVEIEGPAGLELWLLGVFENPTEGFLAVRHQFFTDPDSTEWLCCPCRAYESCVDISGPAGVPDFRESSADRDRLIELGQRSVTCWCQGDANGNGCAGDAEDIASIEYTGNPTFAPSCLPRGCFGDANLDGMVNGDDATFIEE